jgi:hypothetical protein
MADLLGQAGIALYGPEWINPLARALGIDQRTVRRWQTGEMPLTDPDILRRARHLLLARRDGNDLPATRAITEFLGE